MLGSARRVFLVIAALLLAFVGFAVWRQWVLNQPQTVQLTLDLWVAAWRMEKPLPVFPVLVATFTGGFLLASLWLGLKVIRLSRRIRQLEREQALHQASSNMPTSNYRYGG